MSLPKILIVQVGTPPEDLFSLLGDIPAWFRDALDVSPDEILAIRAFEGEPLPASHSNCVAIITGSWAMVTNREPWSEYVAEWIRQAMVVEMPLFGVCYGHQLMAYALGGVVGYHPDGREMGCEIINLLPAAKQDGVIGKWPERFRAHVTHEQTIISLPDGAVSLAYSTHDPHQIVRYGRNAMSTQFHPEFTPRHLVVMIRRREDLLISEGRNPTRMISEIEQTPEAQGVLRCFIENALATF